MDKFYAEKTFYIGIFRFKLIKERALRLAPLFRLIEIWVPMSKGNWNK